MNKMEILQNLQEKILVGVLVCLGQEPREGLWYNIIRILSSYADLFPFILPYKLQPTNYATKINIS